MKKIGVVGVAGGWSSEGLADAINRRTGVRFLVDMEEVSVDLTQQKVTVRGVDLEQFDALLIKKVGPAYSPTLYNRLDILDFLNQRGVRMFSRPAAIKRALNRLTCSAILRSHSLPMPQTVVTEDVLEAVAAVRQYETAVLKPLLSSKGRGSRLIYDSDDLVDEVDAFKNQGNPVLYVQAQVPTAGGDFCIAFLGGEFLGAYARKHEQPDRRLSRNYDACTPPDEVVDLARRAQQLFDLDLTYVEVFVGPDGPLVLDVSAFGDFRSLHQICGIEAEDRYVDYILERLDQGEFPE